MHKGRFSIPPLPMLHVRAWTGHQASELCSAIEDGGWSMFNKLKTVYLAFWPSEVVNWEGEDGRLRELGREKGFEVAYEPEASDDELQFDYFLERHGKPPVTSQPDV
jgi:hypothetical protein